MKIQYVLGLVVALAVFLVCAYATANRTTVSKPPKNQVMSNTQSVRFKISSAKKKYEVQEQIIVGLKLENAADSQVTLCWLGDTSPYMISSVYFDALWEGTFLATYPFMDVKLPTVNRSNFLVLKSGDFIERSLDMKWLIREPGRYTLTATYHNSYSGSEFGLKALVREVKSNAIEVEVVK